VDALRQELVIAGRSDSPVTGLSTAQADERTAAGLANATSVRTSRTVGEIVRANVFTVFNGLLTSLFVLVLITGRWLNALFMVVVVMNTAIGVVQEVRAKHKLDRLAVLTAPRVRVVRDGVEREIPVAAVVLDELLVLAAGDQVPSTGWCTRRPA
jgi:cation-transporting ATPase E